MEAFFDAHCHLAAEAAHSASADQLGAAGRLLCAASMEDWHPIAAVVADWTGTLPAFGVHPWHLETGVDTWLESLEAVLRENPLAWVGEIGLDAKSPAGASEALQESALSAQLQLARRLDRPVNLHCVAAHEKLLDLLDRHYLADGPRPFILHAFAGPYQCIELFAERGAYFTAGPLLFRHTSRKARERAALMPAKRLLLESDAFLFPCQDAGEDLRRALAWLAECRTIALEDMAAAIADNQRSLFPHATTP